MSDSPSFSIIVPTFNRPAMLKRAIESIEKQTFQDFEVIVSDDGSSACLSDVVSCFPHLRIELLTSDRNEGASIARNRAIARSSGRYIAFLDDDDEYQADFLARSHQALRDSPETIGYSWSNVCHVRYAQNVPVHLETTQYRLPEGSLSMRAEDALTIGIGYGVAIRREAVLAAGCFDPSLKLVEDTDLFLKLISLGLTSTLIPGINVHIHHHGGDRMTSASMNAMRAVECLVLIEKHGIFLAENCSLKKQLMLGIRCLEPC